MMEKKTNQFLRGIISGIILTLLVSGVFHLGLSIYRGVNKNENIGRDKIIKEIDELIDDRYLYEVDKKKMDAGAIKGYVLSMGDKYAQYFTPEEFEMLNQSFDGKYYGIGVTIVYDSDSGLYKIDAISKGYGADLAGMKVGSYITKIDGKAANIESINGLLAQIKKMKPGDKVKFELIQDGEEKTFEPEIKEVIKDIVTSKMISDSLYIKISEFDNLTHQQMMNELKKYNNFKGIIIDLRDNPGGDLEAVLNVTSEFIPDKLITYTEDKYKHKTIYNGKKTGTYSEVPMVVLVNKNSASASELFTGAIKDYKRGTIIGSKTFGKGIVQEIIPLNNGGAFKQTIMNYFTPNGNNIQDKGIEPDIKIEEYDKKMQLEDQPEITEALKALNK